MEKRKGKGTKEIKGKGDIEGSFRKDGGRVSGEKDTAERRNKRMMKRDREFGRGRTCSYLRSLS